MRSKSSLGRETKVKKLIVAARAVAIKKTEMCSQAKVYMRMHTHCRARSGSLRVSSLIGKLVVAGV